jgi:hypothetical protein
MSEDMLKMLHTYHNKNQINKVFIKKSLYFLYNILKLPVMEGSDEASIINDRERIGTIR